MNIYKYPSSAAQERLDSIVGRTLCFAPADVEAVQSILDSVRARGDEALIDYVNRFDAPGLKIEDLKVSEDEIQAALRLVDKDFQKSLDKAATQIEAFHRKQLETSWFMAEREGTMLGQLVRPVNAAGVYVPGGKGGQTPLVSSVLMGCIPAKIAGVRHVCITTPPTKGGQINPFLLAAAVRAGVDNIYKAGSAWGIAAFAFGTQTVPKADIIVGPGNIYVTLAKKLVAGAVGIDLIAGPSEVLIIADDKAIPSHVAADLLSQAEHDALASSVLITTCSELAQSVSESVAAQLQSLPRKDIAESSLNTYGAIVVVDNLNTAFEIANQIAPEHLELQVQEPFKYLSLVQAAGAVFLGYHTPESVGDYIAGPNHVLPTAGTARYSSALSVNNFFKRISVIYYGEDALEKDGPDIVRLANIEGLQGHANAVSVRATKQH